MNRADGWSELCEKFERGEIREVDFIDQAHEMGVCTSVIADELRKMRVEVEGLA